MSRAEVLAASEATLERAGFNLSQRCISRRSCFDVAARKGGKIAFIKVHANIGNVCIEEASELQMISQFFSATPLFICEKTRRKPLEDDTVYSRYNVYAITPKTLEDAVLNGMDPLVEAGPGGCYIKVDGSLIRKRRLEIGLSVGKLAEMIGISRRTLYGYEKGMAKASVSAAYRLEWVLGVPVVQFINLFQSAHRQAAFLNAAKRIFTTHRFLQKVIGKFAQFDFKVTQMDRAPFDFIVRCSENGLKIVGGVSKRKEQNVDQRAKEILSISKIIKARSVFITDGKEIPNNDIPLICHNSLVKMRTPQEFIERI